MEQSIEAGLDALLAMKRPGGRFTYRTGSGIPASEKIYNILRHSGAVFSLIECRAFAPEDIRRPIVEALRWVERDHLRALVSGKTTLLVVASEDAGRGRYEQCKLGGTALFLLAACRAVQEGLHDYPLDMLRRLGGFILAMQRTGGGFHSKYDRLNGSVNPTFESLYYPGEAALALLQLHRLDPQGPWFGSAEQALLFLADKRRGRRQVEADHWSLIASALYLETDPDRSADRHRRILAHAAQVVRSMLSEYEASRSHGIVGCFTGDGRTCPTATRLEGLTAMAPHLAAAGEGELAAATREAVGEGGGFLLAAQIREGDRCGAFPQSASFSGSRGSDGVVPRADEVRIDYIQHAICALKGVLDHLPDGGAAPPVA